jgi:hypothetical protein
MTCGIDIISALGDEQATLVLPAPDHEVWELHPGEFAVVIKDAADCVVRSAPLHIVPDDEWPFEKSGAIGIETPASHAPARPFQDVPDDSAGIPFDPYPTVSEPFSDLPDDASPEEIRRYCIAQCQQLLDNPNPRVAKLKTQFLDDLAKTVDAVEKTVQAFERRLKLLIDAEARRARKTFHVVRNGKTP